MLGSDVLSPSLQPDIVGTVALSNSLHWHSRSDVEWSVDVETELLVEALGSVLGSLVEVDDLPSLVGIVLAVSILAVDDDLLTFFVLSSLNFNHLVVGWIDQEFTLQLEDLEPLRVGAPDLHISGST